MLFNMKKLLERTEPLNRAVGAFNVVGLESIQAVIAAAEALDEPVILQFAQTHEAAGYITLEEIGPIMVMMAKAAKVPIAVHLDHGVELGYLRRALDMGFTSIMYDGSGLPYEENVANTKLAVSIAKQYGASIEGEVGQMSGITLETGTGMIRDRGMDKKMFTSPSVAADFVERTGVDCIACAFGTVHGLYRTKPNLDFNLVQELHEKLNVPIVMHGGSGVSDDDYRKVISAGVRKINYYTYMAKAGGEAAKAALDQEKTAYFHDISVAATRAMQKNVEHAISVFRNSPIA